MAGPPVYRHGLFELGVPDPGSRDRDVVLVRAGLLGKPERGSGIWNRVGMGRGWERGCQFTSKGSKNRELRYNMCYILYMCI